MIRSGLPSLSRSTSNRSGLPSPVVSATQTSGLPSPSVSALASSTRSVGSLISTPLTDRAPSLGRIPARGRHTGDRARSGRDRRVPAVGALTVPVPVRRDRPVPGTRPRGVLDRAPYAAPVDPWEAASQDAAEVLGRALAGEDDAVAGAFDAVVSSKGMAG